MRLYLKYVSLVVLDLLSLLSSIPVVPILSLFTKAKPDLNERGEPWGWIYGTWDNPPQGDEKWQREGWFPHITTGFRGYLNRIGWLYRNPCYGFQRLAGIDYARDNVVTHTGNENISDKYKIPGSYLAKVRTAGGDLIAFEYYIVKPWRIGSFEKCFRMRIGWKVMTDKYERYGFAALVDTINPIKSYGK